MPKTVTAAARLRQRNQLTLPDGIVREAGIKPGDKFIVEVDEDDHDTVRLHRIRTSYAGALRGLWGEDANEYLKTERDAWD